MRDWAVRAMPVLLAILACSTAREPLPTTAVPTSGAVDEADEVEAPEPTEAAEQPEAPPESPATDQLAEAPQESPAPRTWDPSLPHCDDLIHAPPCHIFVTPSWKHHESSMLLMVLGENYDGRVTWASKRLEFALDDPGETYCVDVSKLTKKERRRLLARIREVLTHGQVEDRLASADDGPFEARPGDNCRYNGPSEYLENGPLGGL